jgi:hypothetical protein
MQLYDATVHEEEKEDRDNAGNESPGCNGWLYLVWAMYIIQQWHWARRTAKTLSLQSVAK